MADAKHDFPDAAARQKLKLVFCERTTRNLKERFGDVLRHRPQPCCETAGKNGHRIHHENRILVPSKSKRKRTSSRPAVAIASRSDRCFSVYNIRTPPPPAPTSFPPSAPCFRPSSYHSSIWELLIPLERRFLCSQCSCISAPNSAVRPASSAIWLRQLSSLM